MRKKIYLAVAEALRKAGAAKYISLWNADTEAPEQAAVTEFPAVYVEFTPIEWEQRTGRVKAASLRLNLHILTACPAQPESGSPTQAQALAVFDVLDRIVSTVQGVSGAGFNRLQHVETIPDHAHGVVQHDVEGFVCGVEDHSAVRARTTICPPAPEIRRPQ